MNSLQALPLKEIISERFSFMLEDDLVTEIATLAIQKTILSGDTIINYGDYIKSIPLVLDGAIKIMRQDSNGNELLLYFVESGDTCAMTLACCVSNLKSTIRAVAETNSQVILVPIEKMDEWMQNYKSWRNFVVTSYNTRLYEAIDTIDKIAFMKLDERLMSYLQDLTKINHSSTVQTTHEEIAQNLNTSRVVISRLLKQLEVLNKVKLSRNQIEVIDL